VKPSRILDLAARFRPFTEAPKICAFGGIFFGAMRGRPPISLAAQKSR